MRTAVTIAPESARQPDIITLIRALDDYHLGIYPLESNHMLDIETLCGPDVRFYVARPAPAGGEPLGIGALWVRPDRSFGEVKRMFVLPAARGLGVGRQLLGRIEQEARRERLPWLRLETGTLSNDALKLYAAGGFRRCGPFADYPDHPMSVFMEKPLDGPG